MESKCSFFKLVGGVCDYDKRYPSGDTAPLSSCDRGIVEYVRSVGISDISSEIELILARASTFSFPSKISAWTVCPAHRSSLGIGWRRGANRCRVHLGLLSIPTKGRLIVVLARRSPRKFSVTQGSLFPQDLVCNQLCYSEVKPRALRKLCV